MIYVCIIHFLHPHYITGRYSQGKNPPFDTGFEGIGVVMWVGENKKRNFNIGDPVCFFQYGAFAEYQIIRAKNAFPLPGLKPEFIALLVSGATAALSLEKFGELKPDKKVIVTAAAGGTGQFAVQLARLAGCHVIGTCSTDDKADFLRDLGCNRAINYRKEDLRKVLREEYPNGIDLVYESVGGEVFNNCVQNLAIGGQLIIIGMISQYQESSFHVKPTIPIQQILLSKSASLRGFLLPHYRQDIPKSISNLAELYISGKLKVAVDFGQTDSKGPFKGITSIVDGVEYLYSKKSTGKIVVDLWNSDESKL